MLSSLVFESPSLWPLSAALGIVLSVVVIWLYPAQVRGAGLVKWLPPVLRWIGVSALAISLLQPVFRQPKTAEQWGAIVVLIDCSRSMSVVDSGRGTADQVALAAALDRLPGGVRSEVAGSLGGDIDRVEYRLREVGGAFSDLDYAKVTGRGINEKEAAVREAVVRYAQVAGELSARAAAFPEKSDLHERLKEIGQVPAADARAAWSGDVKRQIERLQAAVVAFQQESDEQLYKSNADVRAACNSLAKLSRLELARDALMRPQSGLIARLGGQFPIVGLAIDRDLAPIDLTSNGKPIKSLKLAADANQSDIAGAVTAAINGMAKRPLRAIVLLSDGRQVGGRGDITSSVRPSGVPIFSVGLAPPRTPDVAIANVTLSSTSAFSGEMLGCEVEVTDDGDVKPPAELHVTGPFGDQVEKLVARARRDGRGHGQSWAARFAVQIRANDEKSDQRLMFWVPASPGEITLENNRVDRWIKVSSDQLKVAICTGAPSWDFQYLRDSLANRPWVKLETHILNPENPHLALTAPQILDQDVVILDDVPVNALNVNQWDAIDRLISARGGSVILIPGTSYSIADYRSQPKARSLLPFRDMVPSWKQWPGEQPAFHFTPTPLGEREALRLGDGAESSDRRWQELPGVFGYLQIPESNLLADVQPLLTESTSHNPVLTERRLGAGRVFFLGLDETWRWRMKNGEREADQFWRQLVRHAAGEPYALSRGPLALDVDKVAAQPGQSVHVRARIRGGKSPSPSAASCELNILRDGKIIATRSLTARGGGHFAGDIADLPTGDYDLDLRGLAANNSPLSLRVPLHIADSDEAEMRDVSGDPALLSRISRSSGGQYLPIEQVDRLPERLHALHETESQFTRIPLWNSPMFFGFVLACFAGEWALRKWIGLA